MTKEQLRNYQTIKNEHRQIEQRLRNLERQPESDQATLQPLRECYSKKLEELVAAQLEIERAITVLAPCGAGAREDAVHRRTILVQDTDQHQL